MTHSFKCFLQFILFGGYIFFFTSCLTTEYNVGTHNTDYMIYSTDREVSIGQNVAKQIAKKFEISENPFDIQRVSTLGAKIAQICDRKEISYYFYVIEKDPDKKSQVNAFALPGGYVYIFKELLDMLDDQELAFVLSHEVGHIVSRHSIKRLQAAMGYNLLILASTQAPSDNNFSAGVSFALSQLMSAYSREDELNADRLAVNYLTALGYDGKSGISVIKKLHDKDKRNIRPLSYFRTHPYTGDRIRGIKESLHLPLDASDYIN
ncbi:MAG: M48 family metalloprotease [Candidatus Omnitrophica bacterium]|nr:M48 family metalloprotease [Candidatus Omnitrophota bacterium]